MIENNAWQRIPGTISCEIYPLEKKPNFQNSNAYIIRSETMFLVIDPGGEEQQRDVILDVISQSSPAKKIPVLILLTHCHIDHFNAVFSLMDHPDFAIYLGAQECGAKALAEGDKKLTLSYLFNQSWNARSAEVRFLTEEDQQYLKPRNVQLSETFHFQLQTQILPANGKHTLFCQSFQIGKNDVLHLYHTPGHSPDGICYQLGEFLFTGDLFLAANPGVAGIVGWNQEALDSSLTNLLWLMNNHPVDTCFTGHGRNLPGTKALEILQRTIHASRSLTDTVLLDSERVQFLKDYTTILLDEISELLTVISGKLLSISYFLSSLSEDEEAQQIIQKLDIDSIDASLSEFNQFIKEFDSQKMIKIEIPLKAYQVIAKINKIFDDTQLKEVVDLSLLRRVRWLMIDFLETVQGTKGEVLGSRENLSQCMMDYLIHLQKPGYSNENFLDSVDKEQSFLKELTRRIAIRNVFEALDITYTAKINTPDVYISKDRFFDMITSLLEPVACAGAKQLTVSVFQDNKKIQISIELSPAKNYQQFLTKKIHFVQRILSSFGGLVYFNKKADHDVLVIKLLPADDYFPVH